MLVNERAVDTRPVMVGRVDAGVGAGAGHLVRTRTLASAWVRRGGRAILLVPESARSLETIALADDDVEVRWVDDDPKTLTGVAVASGADWVVIDGYHLGAAWHDAARSAGAHVVAIDDHGIVGSYQVDLVVDQNLDAEPARYIERGAGMVLSGLRYALLPVPAVSSPGHRRVLVTMGAGESEDSRRFVEALVDALPHDVAVDVVGPGLRALDRPGVEVQGPVPDLTPFIARVSVAVSAAGSTAWQLCAAGVPALLVSLVENQRRVASRASAAGAAHDLGPVGTVDARTVATMVAELLDSPERRAAMSVAGRSLVDAAGASRVVTALRAQLVSFRPVAAADAALLHDWANDAVTRAMSFSTDPIDWFTHVEWLDRKLADERCEFVIAMEGTTPVGQIRFDDRESLDGPPARIAEVSISVGNEHRGRGLAPAMLRAATERRLGRGDVQAVIGYVQACNEASARTFVAADYDAVGPDDRGATIYQRRAGA